ncbi:hypothetical protein SLEP1_g58637 [Rubroshorea leprosula]|uniref:Uncharacterized protein n=1 Tax=Rubroshorea leprosula TaxID=152421 RepID=A0AAV5MSP5_9ROSI|nr:hypothetical protein SLEP1_g58637 [Rubroshorea leprosula]
MLAPNHGFCPPNPTPPVIFIHMGTNVNASRDHHFHSL